MIHFPDQPGRGVLNVARESRQIEQLGLVPKELKRFYSSFPWHGGIVYYIHVKIILDPVGEDAFAVHHSYPEIVTPDLTVGIGIVSRRVIASQGVQGKIHESPIAGPTLYLDFEFFDDLAFLHILHIEPDRCTSAPYYSGRYDLKIHHRREVVHDTNGIRKEIPIRDTQGFVGAPCSESIGAGSGSDGKHEIAIPHTR